ncbi:MAG TPA: ATP synthase F1 subunit epsilon [Actinomycetota bacterium]|nr:ATP synthase F1 subunit epsilon [Actinomycetota bacterium]
MPLTVQVVTPEREVEVSEGAELVIARGTEGEVGIMPGHAPLLISLGMGPLAIVHAGGRREVLAIDGGFLQVSRDQVIVLAEYAVNPAEVDASDHSARIDDLKRRIAAEAEAEDLKRQLARAELVHDLARV